MSQLEGSHRLALPTPDWLPRLPLSQWILALGLAIVIATLPGLWTLPGLVVLAAALVVLMKPEAAVYLLTLSVPLGYLLEIEGDEFSVTPTEAIVGMMVIGWALRALGRRSLVIPLTPLLVPLVGMLAVVAFSGNHAVAAGLTLKESLKWGELLLVYLFVIAEMGSLRHALGLLSMLFLGAGIEALIGAAQFFFNLGPDFYSVGRFMRAYGTFEQPNPYAGYLGMIIPLAFGLVLAQPKGRWRNWTLIVLAMAVAAVGMSLSRGAWMGISLAIAAMMLFWSHHTRILLAAGTLAATPLAALAYMNLLPAELATRMATVLDYFRFVDVTREAVTPDELRTHRENGPLAGGPRYDRCQPSAGHGRRQLPRGLRMVRRARLERGPRPRPQLLPEHRGRDGACGRGGVPIHLHRGAAAYGEGPVAGSAGILPTKSRRAGDKPLPPGGGGRGGRGWATSRVHVPRAEGDEPLPYGKGGRTGRWETLPGNLAWHPSRSPGIPGRGMCAQHVR